MPFRRHLTFGDHVPQDIKQTDQMPAIIETPQWSAPVDYESRNVVVLGGGVLGRRIGYNVVIRDITQKQCDEALQYISENVAAFAIKATTGRSSGTVSATLDLEYALQGAWIVFECVPEILELKIDTFAELERLAPRDCILASNSSSYKSSEMITIPRLASSIVMPPVNRVVELMTDGHTFPELIQWLSDRHAEAGLSPYIAVKESTGFIFNRIWAAIKRECLMVLAEGVSTPEQLDKAWMEILGCSFGPCMSMDSVGLDTVALIEKHYIKERGLGSEFTVDYLQKQYLDHGKLGMKSDKGGLYPRVQPKVVPAVPTTAALGPEKGLVVLDMGLGQPLAGKGPAEIVYSGRLLEVSLDGKTQRVISKNLPLPDGVDFCDNKLYYTNMGIPSQNDGSIVSVNLDDKGGTTIIPPGKIYTPKQISIDQIAKKLYVADREGCRIWRSNTDGSNLEMIIDTNTLPAERTTPGDIMSQCVGVTVAPKLGKFFWTQKGPSKGNLGRIFSANIDFPTGCTALDREDICTIADKLPECIDLDYVEASNTLYWTDRGEVPFGNCLYKAQLDDQGRMAEKPQILAQNYNEAIGLKVDAENDVIYVTDLGGSIWRCRMDGSDKRKVLDEQTSCFTGLTLV
ncbi:3-hydroxyacyl-CoA dehydrogenase [Aureobasidium pullulans]|uniref:3-hydroxyacyl-CoA dehydrogenase n=1 Tax=Aureobasidium pullulans TaxID=5580 RepID=A0A4S9BV20_AURPU|nr:3-hydroxyacyl-CoA dehydrogenase [Aureobasidium pullulans]